MATENARKAGGEVDFCQGNAASMPFSQETFDLIVCRAAFKNFSRQSDAIDEIYRVLKPGGNAIIIDLETDEAPQWKAVLPCSLNRRPGACICLGTIRRRFLVMALHALLQLMPGGVILKTD